MQSSPLHWSGKHQALYNYTVCCHKHYECIHVHLYMYMEVTGDYSEAWRKCEGTEFPALVTVAKGEQGLEHYPHCVTMLACKPHQPAHLHVLCRMSNSG